MRKKAREKQHRHIDKGLDDWTLPPEEKVTGQYSRNVKRPTIWLRKDRKENGGAL